MNNETKSQWSPPIPLRAEKSSLIAFPVDALPPILREMAQAVSCTTSTDVAMAGTVILSAVSYCFSGIYRMSGKRDHTEPLVIDSLTIAEPSFKKFPVISMIKRPFVNFVREWNEQHKDEIFRSQAEKKLLSSQLENLEKQKDVTPEQIADVQTKISNLNAVEFRRIVVDDITPESLVYQLSVNGTLLMMSDEAGMLGNFSGNTAIIFRIWTCS
jgi:hypothetical protein